MRGIGGGPEELPHQQSHPGFVPEAVCKEHADTVDPRSRDED